MNMPIPRTYYDWSLLLKALKDKLSDEDVIAAMEKGEFVWQGDSSARLVRRIFIRSITK